MIDFLSIYKYLTSEISRKLIKPVHEILHWSHIRAAKALTSLHKRVISREPSLLAYKKLGQRWRPRSKVWSLVPLDSQVSMACQNAEKATHIKGILLDQAMILFNCIPLSKWELLLKGRICAPRGSKFFPLWAVPCSMEIPYHIKWHPLNVTNVRNLFSVLATPLLLYSIFVPGIPGGNIPGTSYMFFKTCASSEAGRKYQVMKDPKELQGLFKENKVDLSKPFIAMCGTGMYPLNITYICFFNR